MNATNDNRTDPAPLPPAMAAAGARRRGPSRFRKRDLRRAIDCVKASGLNVIGVKFTVDGSLLVLTSNSLDSV
jgi:hypothetical protein